MIKEQPAEATTTEETSSSFFSQVAKILSENWQQLLRGAGITLLISIVGTIIGLIIGLAIGVSVLLLSLRIKSFMAYKN